MAIKESIVSAATNLTSQDGRSAVDEPKTHILIPLGKKSLPVPVDAAQVRHNLSWHPDDKTRNGEEHTIVPDPSTTKII